MKISNASSWKPMDKNAKFSTTFTSEDAVPSYSSLSKN